MGTKVQYKSYLPGRHPMGDLNDDSNSGTWPVLQPSSNGHNSYSQNTIADAYFGDHTEAVKQKILEHEAIFKTQLYELHRLYQVQRDLIDELKMNEFHKQSLAIETSMSSCSASHRQDALRWNTSSAFPAAVGATDIKYTLSVLASPQNGLVSSSNVVGPKDCEVEILECRCRPSKVRRKFDLELRADEYIDLEEPNFNPKRPQGVSCYTTNGSCNDQPSSGSQMLLGGSIKIDRARLKNGENGSAELPNQTHVQGKNSSLDYVGCDSSFRSNQQFCSIRAPPLEFMHHARDDIRSRNLTIVHKENGRMWPHMIDSAPSKGQTTAFSQNKTSEKISLLNKQQDAPSFQSGQIKADYLKERFEGGSKPSRNGIDVFNGLGSVHQSKKSFSASAPWEVSSCITQKSAKQEMHPCFISAASFPQSVQSSSTSVWQNKLDDGKRLCSGSGPTSYSPVGSDYYTSGLTFLQNGSMNIKGLDNVEARSAKGIDLNVASIGDSHDYRPYGGHVADFPWMKSSSGLKNGEIQSFKWGVAKQASGLDARSGADHILRVPIFRDCLVSKGASSRRLLLEEMERNGNVRGFDMNLPCESEENDVDTHVISGKKDIDLNVCLTDYNSVMTTSVISEMTVKGFDLEAPGETEEDLIELKQQRPDHLDEDLVTVAAEAIFTISSWRKLALADTPARHPSVDSTVALKWFVDVISSNDDDAEKVSQEVTTEEADSMDYFEYMTLKLPETEEDDYLPDFPKPTELDEHTEAGPCTTRPRKGQARRCRAKRDFQRDILPGLTSLARHEVTEDLQTLGGLMRAMGHSWQSGLTRRAGPRRGRPRLTPLPPPNPALATSPTPSPQKRTTANTRELVTMEDHRSLTGWGKTTRRPRRQRCPTGNGNNNSSVLRIA